MIETSLRRTLLLLATTGTCLGVLSVPVTARAAECPTPFWGIHCPPRGYLFGAYGPVARSTQIDGNRARFGFFSPGRNGKADSYVWSTAWMPIWSGSTGEIVARVEATDHQSGAFYGYASVESAYGPVSWGTQYWFISGSGYTAWFGRWGVYNLLTGLFYPDGNGQWYPALEK